MNLDQIQHALRERKLGGWLLCDFRNRDQLAYRILGLDPTKMSTRRWFYYIPAKGEPKRLVHTVEKGKLDTLPGGKQVFLSWEELHSSLKRMLGSPKKIAMQYSPKNNIPYVSIADAGIVELVRSFGHRVVSSADLVQLFEALISEEGYRLHKEAGVLVDQIRAEAFEQIRRAVSSRMRPASCSASSRMALILSSPATRSDSISSRQPMLFHREQDHRRHDEAEDHHRLRYGHQDDDGAGQFGLLRQGPRPGRADPGLRPRRGDGGNADGQGGTDGVGFRGS